MNLNTESFNIKFRRVLFNVFYRILTLIFPKPPIHLKALPGRYCPVTAVLGAEYGLSHTFISKIWVFTKGGLF